MEAAENVRKLATSHGIDGHSMSLRWVLHHSILSREYGDAIIIGASSVDQLKLNLDAVEMGPLPEDLVAALNGVFDECDGEVVPYSV
jgi:aflatoxin B1 aldehyde reductase